MLSAFNFKEPLKRIVQHQRQPQSWRTKNLIFIQSHTRYSNRKNSCTRTYPRGWAPAWNVFVLVQISARLRRWCGFYVGVPNTSELCHAATRSLTVLARTPTLYAYNDAISCTCGQAHVGRKWIYCRQISPRNKKLYVLDIKRYHAQWSDVCTYILIFCLYFEILCYISLALATEYIWSYRECVFCRYTCPAQFQTCCIQINNMCYLNKPLFVVALPFTSAL